MLQIDVLVFQGPPKALDEDIVHPASASVHRNLDSSFEPRTGEVHAGELAALVGVENFRLAYVVKASSRASTQNEASIVFDSRHDSTARLAQSINATR